MGTPGGTVQVRRWRRYGKDRLYATDAAGAALGWVDAVTGAVTPDRPDVEAAVRAAVAAFCAEHRLRLPGPGGPDRQSAGTAAGGPAPAVGEPPEEPADDAPAGEDAGAPSGTAGGTPETGRGRGHHAR